MNRDIDCALMWLNNWAASVHQASLPGSPAAAGGASSPAWPTAPAPGAQAWYLLLSIFEIILKGFHSYV